MTRLENYHHFAGRHWETGSFYNDWDYQGLKAPHTGEPYSEALLLGVSGGIVMGYFSFAYKGFDPQARILTRNTFSPITTMLSRLGVMQGVRQTAQPEKAVANLLRELENGIPAIVWADAYSLPYNCLSSEDQMWFMRPILVYGYDQEADSVWIADRSQVPLTVTTGELAQARGRVKKDKYRLTTLGPPNPERLAAAVQQGIWDCIKLFTEKPPVGGKNNFGFAAYHWWVELLTKSKARMSWEREFPAGSKLYSGLTWAFTDINTFTRDDCADRALYAEFLDEASLILNRPSLQEAAERFRSSAEAWGRLSLALLPDEIQLFKETRQLLLERHELFRVKGGGARPRIVEINTRLKEIKANVAAQFPLSPIEVGKLRENLASHVEAIAKIETEAVQLLTDVLQK